MNIVILLSSTNDYYLKAIRRLISWILMASCHILLLSL